MNLNIAAKVTVFVTKISIILNYSDLTYGYLAIIHLIL